VESSSCVPLVSIITAVWNKPEVTVKFLEGLDRWVHWPTSEVVIVDDGSKPRTARILGAWRKNRRKRTVLVRNETQLGFGPSNNRGVRISQGNTIILVNNDVKVLGDFGRKVTRALQMDSRQIVCAQLVNWDSGWNKFGKEVIKYANGWFLGMTRIVWDDLEGFDEQFVPCDYEDMDLSMKAHQQGIRLNQIEVPLQHLGGITTRQLKSRRAITLANQKKFIEKWGLESPKP